MKKLLLMALLFSIENSMGETLSWEKAVLVAQKNAQLLAAKEELSSAQKLIKSSRSGYLPQLSGKVSYTESGNNWGTSSDKKYNTSIELRQNIFSGLSDDSKVNEYKARAKVFSGDLKLIKAQVSYNLKKSFAELSFAQESINLSKEIVRRRRDNLGLVELRYQGGKENQGSVLLAKASLAQAQYDHLQVSQNIGLARIEFAKSLGREEYQNLNVKGDIPPIQKENEIALHELAIELPSYIKANAQVEISQFQLQQNKSTFYPSLDFVTNFGKTDSKFLPKDENWSLGLNLTIPLFNGGQDYYQTESSINKLNAAKYGKEQVQREALVSLQKELYGLELAGKKLEVDKAFLQAAITRAKIAQEKYNNGLMSFEDWELIENDLTTRKKNHLLAKKNKIFAEAAWELAKGEGAIQ